MKNKIIFFYKVIFLLLFLTNTSFADLQKDIANKILETKTLSFNFIQKISEDEEFGNCVIKYPLLMKCNYKNEKQKSVISNGKTVAIIKKKYKKIYYYPIKATPLFTILEKEKILNWIQNNKPTKVNLNTIEFELVGKKLERLKILFDKETLELKGWETIDVYSNHVSFEINDLVINKIIQDDFFKIPKENDL